MPELLLVVRTPHSEVLRRDVLSLRVPTETGAVGILPRAERAILVVEAGLLVARCATGGLFVGNVGGLLWVEHDAVTLLSAIAVIGEDIASVQTALAGLSQTPLPEMDLRRRIESLERGLIAESRRRTGAPRRAAEGT